MHGPLLSSPLLQGGAFSLGTWSETTWVWEAELPSLPSPRHAATGPSAQGLDREDHANRWAALGRAVRWTHLWRRLLGSVSFQSLSKRYWTFTTLGALGIKNCANVLTSRWGKIKTWLATRKVGNP